MIVKPSTVWFGWAEYGQCSKQVGVALISMLLVLALITTICMQMINKSRLELRLMQSSIWSSQANLLSLSGEEYGEYLILESLNGDNQDGGNPGSTASNQSESSFGLVSINDLDNGSNNKPGDGFNLEGKTNSHPVKHLVLDSEHDNANAEFTLAGPHSIFAGIQQKVTLVIGDEQAKFNLNNLVGAYSQMDTEQVRIFQSLLASIELEGSLALAVVDWLDKDQSAKGYNTEDLGYLQQPIPYRAANQSMKHISELAAVQGFGSTEIQRLSVYVSALPRSTKININTVLPEVLTAVIPGIDAEAVVARRLELQGFKDVAVFLKDNVTAGLKVNGKLFAVQSDFYTISTEAEFYRSRRGRQSLIEIFHPDVGKVKEKSRQTSRGSGKETGTLRRHWTFQLPFWKLGLATNEMTSSNDNE